MEGSVLEQGLTYPMLASDSLCSECGLELLAPSLTTGRSVPPQPVM